MTVEEYRKRNGFFLSKSALERAIGSMSSLEALALLRAACKCDERYATLAEAKEIYADILKGSQ